MRSVIALGTIWTTACLAPDPCSAQAATPEAAASAFLPALLAGDHAAFAKGVDPAELTRFKEDVMSLLKLGHREGADADLLNMLDGADRIDRVAGLSPADVLARWMRSIHRHQASRSAGTEVTVLGRVLEGDDRAHAVYRSTSTVEGVEYQDVGVVTLRRTAAGWYLDIPAEADHRVLLLRRRLGG